MSYEDRLKAATTPCPKCGMTGLKRNVRAFGICEEHLYPNGDIEMETSNLSFTRPKRIRCLECDYIRTDVEWPE